MMVEQPDGSRLKTLVQFRGGNLQPPVNGIFSTDNPLMIKALDKDSSYGRSFTCIRTEGEPEPPKPLPKEETPLPIAAVRRTVSKKEPKKEPETGPKQVPGIKTLQEARNYLLVNFPELKPSQLNNTVMVKGQATKREIEFVDFK
jgi:hypothetical protein